MKKDLIMTKNLGVYVNWESENIPLLKFQFICRHLLIIIIRYILIRVVF